MHEILRTLNTEVKPEARKLDAMLIDGRKSVVQRNLSQIEGRTRSDKYVGRLAGVSNDVYRKGTTERFCEWFFATSIEDATKSALVGEFLRPLFTFKSDLAPVVVGARDFWSIDEEVNVLMSQVRKAVVTGDRMASRLHLVAARNKIDEALRGIG